MMALFEYLMEIFIKHQTTLIILILFIPFLMMYLGRFDVMYRSPLRYLMGILSLIVVISILLLALPVWIVVLSGNFGFLTLAITFALCFILLWNILIAIQFFTGKKILKIFWKLLGKKYE